ncbi:MAG: hypothetical protein NZ108_03095, partial [Bacteroidia bacterium]|nr:hypothetical protein [Bacteroidia bacterium]
MKNIRFVYLLWLFFFAAHAQDYQGYVHSNYSGVNGIDLQPGSLADNRYLIDLQLIGVSFNFANNYAGLNSLSPDWNDSNFQRNQMKENLNGKPKSVFFNGQFQPFSFIASINRKNAIAFTMRARTFFNLENLDETVARLGYWAWEPDKNPEIQQFFTEY